jgi:hypothetical protein
MVVFTGVLVSFLTLGHAQEGLERARLHVGPVDLHPHLEVIGAYDDNVLLRRTNEEADFSVAVNPGLQLVHGQSDHNFLALDYTASLVRFSRLTSQDANNQFVKLNGHFEVHQLTIGVSHRFQDVKGPSTQIGARVRSRDNITNLDLEYRLSSKTSFGLGYEQYLHEYMMAGLYSSQEYSPYATFFYHMTPKSDLFCRFAYGWVSADQGPHATYQEADIGIRGKLTPKLSGTARFGYHHRSFDGSYGDINAFVVAADLEALLTKRTTFTLGVSRGINPSPSSMGNSYESSRVEAKLSHRLARRKIGLWIGGAYERDDYQNPIEGIQRVDDFWEASAGITWDATKWMEISADYLFWHNDSRLTELGFQRNLASIHARVHF